MISGQMVCEDAGSPLQFPSVSASRVRLQALLSNTGRVVIGGAPNQRFPGIAQKTNGPVASATSAIEGDLLYAGDTITYDVGDLSELWIDSEVDGEGVSWNIGPFAYGPQRFELARGRAVYQEPTNIDTTYNNTTTTATSAAMNVEGFVNHCFGFTLAKANTPTDITIAVQANLGEGGWKQLMNWGLGDWRYDDTAVGTSGVSECYQFQCAAKEIRIVVTAVGTTAANTFTMSASVLRSHV